MSTQFVDSNFADNADIAPWKIRGFGVPYFNPFGATWYVDSVNGANTNGGRSKAGAFATLAYAFTRVAANDNIIVLPGHAESIISAALIAANVAGVNVIGMGRGTARPTFTWSTVAGASMDVSAANITFYNLLFVAATEATELTAMINVSAADVVFAKCEARFRNASGGAVLLILGTSGGDRMLVDGCRFTGTANANTVACIRTVAGQDDVIVRNTTILGNFTTSLGCIDNTGAALNLCVENCFFDNRTASSTVCVNAHASTTGHVSGCRMQILSGTAPIVGAALSWVGGNYYKGTIATGGTLI